MDESSLPKLVEQGETQGVEFKESLVLKDEIGEAVSAFSNSGGGLILIGVSDKKGLQGCRQGKRRSGNWLIT